MSGLVVDEARLRAESAQIERVLEELRGLVVPAAWQRIEQVMRLTVMLYGTGLAHALEFARRAGADRTLDELCADDELLASLLVLHGLHPLTTEQRVKRTLATLRAELELGDDELAIVSLDAATLEVRAARGLTSGAMSPRVAETVIRRAIEAAAPELSSIEIVGLTPAPAPGLVQLRTRKDAP